MARILTVTEGLPSLVYPSVELTRRLAAAGHRATFAGHPDSRRLAEHHGLAFQPIEPSRYVDFLKTDAAAGRIHRLWNFRRRRQDAVDALAVGGFVDAVRDSRPDLILINGEMHEHIIVASAAQMPVALLNSFVSIWRQPGLPPPHHLARPGVGWKGTPLGAALLWHNLRRVKWRKQLAARVRHLGCDRVAVLKELAGRHGFDFRRDTDARHWLIPFTYRRLPVLSLHALEFEFPHRPPAHVQYVGPMVLESRIDRPQSALDRARLETLFERRRRAGSERTLIYAGFGSVLSTDLAFLRRLVRIVEERPAWDVIVSLSNRVARSSLGPLPDRVQAFDWVPQTQVLKHADVAVTHGGINTIDECVLYGVPALVYCGRETDMGGTTSRVVFHGIGIAGDSRRDGPGEIRTHLDRLLREDSFKANVQRLQQAFAAYGENRVAERVVESLLEQSPDSKYLHAEHLQRQSGQMR